MHQTTLVVSCKPTAVWINGEGRLIYGASVPLEAGKKAAESENTCLVWKMPDITFLIPLRKLC